MSIKTWPEQERPREKLLALGSEGLSNAELLAIFLRIGSKGKTAVDLARDLLKQFGDLKTLFNLPLQEFCRVRGLGSAKYAQLQAVLEMSRRYLLEDIKSKPFLHSSQATKQYLLALLGQRKKEVFGCLFLDSKHCIIAFQELFQGSIDRADIYPREVVKAALQHNAAAVILAHNHPSGDPEPSQADIQVTKKLRSALHLVEIRVLDHIVVGRNKSVSFVETGRF